MVDFERESADDMLPHYSAALDEIFRMRKAAAYEARTLAGILVYKSLPAAVRLRLERQHARLVAVARGEVLEAYEQEGVTNAGWQEVMRRSGMPMTLTRWQWEHRNEDPDNNSH